MSQHAWWAITLQYVLRVILGALLVAWGAPEPGRMSARWVLVAVVALWAIYNLWQTGEWIRSGRNTLPARTARSALIELGGCCALVALAAFWSMLDSVVLAIGVVLALICATDYWRAASDRITTQGAPQ